MSRILSRALMTAVLLTVLLPLTAVAHNAPNIPLDKDGLPAWETKEWNDFPVLIPLDSMDHLKHMLYAVPVVHYHREHLRVLYADNGKVKGYQVDTRVTEEEFNLLVEAGFHPQRTEDHERASRRWMEELWADMYAGKKRDDIKTDPLNYVPTNEQMGDMLEGLEETHPNIAKYFSWGSSVDGRTLHGIVISDNVNTHEAEPEVRLSSTMHGDEVPGLVNCVNLAYYLCEHYGRPGFEDVTDLVDNFEIHLMPGHNPDGTAGHTRYNSHGVDLNRNFDLPDGTHTVLEQENRHFKDYANSHHFVASINYHTGALVMNYPWDYTYTLAPDNDAMIKMSLAYSTTNVPMYNGSFPQGITNGADWYVVQGSLQDWVYDQTDCIDITGEVSNIKWPANSAFVGLWNDNRESMMSYIRTTRDGSIHGIVTDEDTGMPLDARVTLIGNSKVTHTDPANGDYYKMADTGIYDIMFESIGYVTQTVTDVDHVWGTGSVVDVAMAPLATGQLSGTVTDLLGNGLDAFVEIRTWPADDIVDAVSTSADDGGAFAFDIYYGDYTVTATAADHFTESQQVTVGETPATMSFELGGMITLYPLEEDFESGMGVFEGDWVIGAPGNNSDNCLMEADGIYPNNANLLATVTTPVDLTNVMDPQAHFSAKWSIEDNWDGVFFEVSTNGGTSWAPVAVPGHTSGASGQGGQTPSGAPVFEGEAPNWVNCVADLSPYLGESDVRFRFRMASDTSVQEDGFFLDNFQIVVVTEELTTSPTSDTPELVAKVQAYPNPFNPRTTVKYTNPRAGKVLVNVYDVQGRLIRTLVDGDRPAGPGEVSWDGVAQNGRPANSGIYFARFVAADGSAVGSKLVLVK